MKSIRFAGFVGVVIVVLMAGCESDTQKTATLPGAGTISPGLTEIGAMAAAEQTYSNSLGGMIELGDIIPIPIVEGIWPNPDESNIMVTADYSYYVEPIQGTGWKSLDEFTSHPTGYSASARYGNFPDTPSDDSIWLIQGGYAQNLGKSVVKANVGLGGFDSGGTEDVLTGAVGYDYYVARDFSLGLLLSYEHLKAEDGDTSSDGRYYLNLGYLFDMANPVLLKFSYGRIEINNSDGAMNDIVLSADWVIKEKFLVGVAASRMSDSDSWSNFWLLAKLNAGYQITPDKTVGLGYNLFHFGGSDNDYGGFNVNYSQRF